MLSDFPNRFKNFEAKPATYNLLISAYNLGREEAERDREELKAKKRAEKKAAKAAPIRQARMCTTVIQSGASLPQGTVLFNVKHLDAGSYLGIYIDGERAFDVIVPKAHCAPVKPMPSNIELVELKPCNSPYCECERGKCTHPGCYDARG